MGRNVNVGPLVGVRVASSIVADIVVGGTVKGGTSVTARGIKKFVIMDSN